MSWISVLEILKMLFKQQWRKAQREQQTDGKTAEALLRGSCMT